MKKIMYLTLLVVGLAGCQKSKKISPVVTTDEASTEVVTTKNNAKTGPTNSKYRIFSRIRGSYSCSGCCGNCLPDVIVKASEFSVLVDDLLTTLDNNDAEATRLFFAQNNADLSDLLTHENVVSVINKKAVVTKLTDNGISNYIVFDVDGVEQSVVPIIK